VLNPWNGPSRQTIRARFVAHRRAWTLKVATPLDGDLSVRLAQGSDALELLGAAHTVIARGIVTLAGGKSLHYRICGERSLELRVRAGGKPAPFTLRLTKP
jgi:hypothetical protein